MIVLILNWRDIKHPLAGGAEISLHEQAKFWKKKGAKIIWFASSFKNALEKETADGIEVIRKGSHYTVHLWAFWYYFLLYRNSSIVIDNFHFIPFFTPLYVNTSKIIALINEPAKNVWFKNITFPISLIGYLAEPFFFKMYRKVPFITSADSIKSELVEYGISGNNIHIIPHGISIKNTKKSQKEKYPVLMYLSQISPDKGIEDAIDAFEIIHTSYKNSQLWILGKDRDEDYKDFIHRKVKQKNLEDYVCFYGFVSEERKFELLNRAWILIHPSLREGWGLNVIEANAMGTPAVGYNVTGLRDSIKDEETGLLAESNMPSSLANKIIRLIEDKKMYNTLAKNAQKWSTNFSWQKAGQKSWSLIQEVYEKKYKE